MIWKAIRFFSYWLSVGAVAVLVISAVFKPETLPKLSVCSFRAATGRPCPGCGLTRAFCAISHGRFGQALYFNPFSFILYAGAVLLALWPLLKWRFPELEPWLDRMRVHYWLPSSVLAAMIVYGVYRGIYGPYV